MRNKNIFHISLSGKFLGALLFVFCCQHSFAQCAKDFNVSGGGAYCGGGTGVTVTLAGSKTGTNYILYINGTMIGSSVVAGTGNPIQWTNITDPGTYTVVATNGGTCVRTMPGSAIVTVNPLPTQFTVSGGGTICSGSTFSVTLSGSQTGVNYQLKLNGSNTGSPLSGTGSALTWSSLTSAGTYTVAATNATTSCFQTMTGSASVTIVPLPTLYWVLGGGTVCAGNSTSVSLSYSQTGVNYQLRLNGSDFGSPVSGIGATLNWTLTTAGTYTVVATDATTSCVRTMNSSATITVNPLPTKFNFSGGGTFCAEDSYSVTLDGSEIGVNYLLQRNGLQVSNPMSGTGSALTWSSLTPLTGTLTVTAVNATTSCRQTMNGSGTVTVNPLPTQFNVSGGGSICSGSSSSVTLDGSQTGVNYQLKVDGSDIGTTLSGTGSALTWPSLTSAGVYTVLATNATTSCSQTMSGSATIILNALPSQYTVSGGGTVCSGNASSVSLSGSETGINYQLRLNGSDVGPSLSGSGSSLTWGSLTSEGNYSVLATNATTSCSQAMSGTATITVNALPTQFNVSGGGSICIGSSSSVTLSGSETGVNYQLKVDGTDMGSAVNGTGSALSWPTLTSTGNYTLVATNTTTSCVQTMTGSATITVNPLPAVYVVSGGGTVCSGNSSSVTLSGSQAGVNYQLRVNGTNTGTPLQGTGSALQFSNPTVAGTYTITATNISTGCASAMQGNAIVNVNPLPQLFSVSGGGAYCAGGAGLTVSLSGSEIGVTYTLKLYSSSGPAPDPSPEDPDNIPPIIQGTGGPISWPNQLIAADYRVLAENNTTGCKQLMTGVATISVNALPAQFNVSGGGSYCSGGAGVNVILSGSETGVTYTIRKSSGGGPPADTDLVITVNGTGGTISWMGVNDPGVYEILATASTGCSQTMSGTATVTTNPLPTQYTVGGGGSYCQGGTGVSITLSGSDSGVTYQLKLNGSNVGSTITGTGSPLSWNSQAAAGTYTIEATNTTTGCVQSMSGSATITINTLPVVYNLSGGGAYCSGATGTTITLSGSQSGINYQLKINGVNSGVPLAGMGSAISWTGQTTVGTYSVVATNATTGCSQGMTGSPSVSVNPLPTTYNLSGGGTICSGSTSNIILSSSQVGVTYQIRRNQPPPGSGPPGPNNGFPPGTPNIAPVAGTGGQLTWPMTLAGTYTVLGTFNSTGCYQLMNGSPVISVNASPTVYTVSGGGQICAGSNGATVNLSNSQSGINYQLKINGVNSGSVVFGTGSALSWSNQTTAGTYTVVATNGSTGCSSTMTGSASVIVNPLPSDYSVSGGGTICVGDTGPSITLSGSQLGINYQIKLNGANDGALVAGTGSSLTWTNKTSAGSYTVVATNATTLCSSTMTGSATVTVNQRPLSFGVSGSASICSGSSGVTISLSSSQTGVNYQLQIDGINSGVAIAGTGAALNWTAQTTAGTYTVMATNATTLCSSSMSGSAVVTVNPLPQTFAVGGGGVSCSTNPGATVTLSGSENGVNYQLYKNGVAVFGVIVAGTGDALTFSSLTQGVYTITATIVGSGCGKAMTGSATVTDVTTPTASISGSKTLPSDGSSLTLTANSGTGYTYNWLRDGDEIGSTSSTVSVSESGEYKVVVSLQGCSATSNGHFVTHPVKPNYNGLITSASWRTDKAYGTTGTDFSGMYVYRYDDKNQILEGNWATPDFVLNSFSYDGNKFRTAYMAYDPNGNIQSLRRFNDLGVNVHKFSYQYIPVSNQQLNNQLQSIPGYSSYQYNAIGQLIAEDKVAGDDQFVEYDVTGKVRFVYNTDPNTSPGGGPPGDPSGDPDAPSVKVEFIYDDRGFRLAKVNYQTQRTTWYIRDASGSLISTYEQEGIVTKDVSGNPVVNTQPITQTEVPVYGSVKLGIYYPQQNGSVAYELTDHLGNVRAIVKDNTNVYVATMEDSNEASITNPRVEEMQYFQNLFETVDENVYMNHTPSGAVTTPNKAAYLRWVSGMTGIEASDKAVGPSIALRVNPGDTLDIETWARFERKVSYNRDLLLANLTPLLGGTFASTLGFEGLTATQVSSTVNTALIGANYPNDGTDNTRPFAYLNYMIFDQNLVFKNAGWQRVGDDAGFYPNEMGIMNDHEHLKFNGPILINEPGYIYIWVSNQSEDTKVWFDDLTVRYSGSFVTQATDYGVWGDVVRESKFDESVYRFGYQGQFAEKDDETGWNHFEFREYDAAIGRWSTTDPGRQYYSRFEAMGNNPIQRMDPNGRWDDYYIYSDGRIEVVETGTTDNFFYVDSKNNITALAQGWVRNGQGLIQLPSSFEFSGNGRSFAFSVKEGNANRAYVNPETMAALFGAFVETGYNDIVINQFSFANGGSPDPSTSHINGRNGDIRYLSIDASGERTTVFDMNFDVQRNSNFTEALYKFGYTDLKSFHTATVQLTRTSHLVNHDNHLHLQGFRPNITRTRSPSAPVLYLYLPKR